LHKIFLLYQSNNNTTKRLTLILKFQKTNMRRFLTLVLGMLLLSSQLLAQTRTVTGKVTDENGKPLPNVSVQVKGTNVGTVTDAQGQYSLSVPSNAQAITFSSVGATTKEMTLGKGNTINTTLTSNDASMQEVVVVGYGTGRKVGTQVGSVTTVGGQTLQDRPSANAFDALQGKVAGLQVFTSSGEPSQLSSLRLHGVGSLGASSTPLYVMDGIPIDPGTVISLNPNDFETVSVLKDASATSIYGSRAANGVIYITTKRGSANRPPSITLQTQYGQSNLANTDFFNRLMNRKQLLDFFLSSGIYTQAQVDAVNNNYPNADYKWMDAFYQKDVPTYQADLSVSGGSGKTTYYLSGGYLDQQGLAFRSGFHRYTLRSNLNSQVNNWLKVGLNLFVGSDERQTNPYGSNNTNRGLGILAAPWFSPIDPATGKQYNGAIPGWGNNSPEYLRNKVTSTTNNVQFNPSGFITINPIRNLTLKTQAGIEAYDLRTTNITMPSFNNTYSGTTQEFFTRGVSKTITNTGEYKFSVASDHNFTALIGQEFINNTTTGFNGNSSGQFDDRLTLLSSGISGFGAGSSKTEYSYLSYFSRLEYNFRNRYFLDGSFRQDQSSRFGINNRTANFWAVGGMWKAKQEEFFANLRWLTDLTVKTSYGTQGNSAIGNYDWQETASGTQYGGGGGFVLNNVGSPTLGWETQKKFTAAVNFSLYNRARVGVEFYNRTTKNMLIDVPYAYTGGFANITENLGSMKNTGFDLTIDADVFKSNKAYITPYFNMNYNKNEVTELFQGKDYWIIPSTGVLWAVGQPVSFSYPIFNRVNPETGAPEWFLPSTGKIMQTKKDPTAVTSSFNNAVLEQNTGIKRYPPVNGGFGLSAGYSGLSLSADFSFSRGKFMINNDRYFFENTNVFPGYNQFSTVTDYWKKAGDVARFPDINKYQFTQFDSRLIEDASFTRLKAVTVGYALPANILNRTNVVKAARFYVTGRNLLTWTKFTGPDPEVDSNLGLGTNPNTKQVALGLDITF
jgi:TonB-linked SusC/RagA family outer membrane protein